MASRHWHARMRFFGFPPFWFRMAGPRAWGAWMGFGPWGFPRRQEYLEMLEEYRSELQKYKEELEEELREVEKEIEELKKEA